MRFMIIVKATKESETGALPAPEMLAAMGTFNEELTRAGVMVDGAGLKASKYAARVKFSSDNKRTVVDGPFAEAKESSRATGSGSANRSRKRSSGSSAARTRTRGLKPARSKIRPFFELDEIPDVVGAARAMQASKK